MSQNQPKIEQRKGFFSFSKYTIIVLLIIGISFLIRFYYFPFDVPLTSDALYYFWYSSEIFQIGELPNEWSPSNTGWPIFVSFFFTISNSEEILTLMEIQRLLSVVISVLITIPAYFLCKKFVDSKFAIIGASLIAFDPRLIINSFLGVTDSLYLLLISTSLVLFIQKNNKTTYLAFTLATFATVVRSEGLVFFIALSIIYLIKNRNEREKIILKYGVILGIFFIILMPIINYQNEVGMNNTIFVRSIESGINLTTNFSEQNSQNDLANGVQTLIKYLVWIMIPNFIIFVPIGIYLIFKNRNFEKNTIIFSLCIMTIPALYAYTVPALDTRYLYVLFPIFTVLSVITIKNITNRLKRQDFVIVIIIVAILVSSILFYEYKKIDYSYEREVFEIMKDIPIKEGTVNSLVSESEYIKTIQTIEKWPNTYSNINFDFQTINYDNEKKLLEFITESREQNITHILTDMKPDRPEFLKDVFVNEVEYSYLEKIYDSKNEGFDYHVKLFKIDYEELESLKINNYK